MKILSLNVESLYWISQVLSFVLLAGTVVLGGVALFTGKILNDRQSKDLLSLSTKLEEQREKTAKAEESLEQFKRRTTLPRHITDESLSILRRGPKGKVQILYLDNNQEAYLLATRIRIAFEMTGWAFDMPKPTTVDRTSLLGVKLEVGSALYKQEKQSPSGIPLQLEEPAQTLWEFFKANLQSAGMGGFECSKDIDPNALVVIVSPKM